jgi:hypothetical protein
MKFRSLFVIPLLITAFILNGCAVLFNSDEYTNFHSDPSGAKVYINGVFLGKTPLNLVLDASKSYAVEFRKEGYESKTYMLSGSVGAGWVVLDIFGGLIPILIDAASGAWYELDSNVYMNLETKEVPAGKVK